MEMATRTTLFFFCFLLHVNLVAISINAATSIHHFSTPIINRSSFPSDFVFGAATAAYQIEGAASYGGRGPSIWDTFTHQQPDKIWDHSSGDVGVDFYHRYKGDVQIVKELGMGALRLSISWTRLLPNGKISGGVNQEGIKFYNNVIDELIANGLKPFVTLHHWDPPQVLEDEYGGFLHPNIVNHYRDYVDLCFKEFGDRVKHWITLNEPLSFSMYGYATGTFAPGRCSNYIGNCTMGNSATEPYTVAHHLLLCHATAVQVYRNKYQKSQKGEIGITLVTPWIVPKDSTREALKASYRALDFSLGWFLHPITYGDYPPSMRTNVGNRLPKFSEAQSNMLKGSLDFLGINYYTSNYASPMPSINTVDLSYTTDHHVDLTTDKNGVPIGTPTALNWLFNCPSGIRDLMLYIRRKYNNPAIYITENGIADLNNSTMPVEEAIKDELRVKYYEDHLFYLHKAIKEGANVKGHFVWSLLDDYEWDAGYTVRFGLHYVDQNDGFKRHPKLSALWFKKFLENHRTEEKIQQVSSFLKKGLFWKFGLNATTEFFENILEKVGIEESPLNTLEKGVLGCQESF